MVISDFLHREHIVLGLPCGTKPKLLTALAERAGEALGIPADAIFTALNDREALGSTGIGRGIAVPHARIPGLHALFASFTSLRKPIDFAAVDGQPVDLVFLLLVPANAAAEHLPALASVSRRLRDPDVADRIRAAWSAESAYALLTDVSARRA